MLGASTIDKLTDGATSPSGVVAAVTKATQAVPGVPTAPVWASGVDVARALGLWANKQLAQAAALASRPALTAEAVQLQRHAIDQIVAQAQNAIGVSLAVGSGTVPPERAAALLQQLEKPKPDQAALAFPLLSASAAALPLGAVRRGQPVRLAAVVPVRPIP